MIRTFEKHEPQISETAYIDETAIVIGDVSIGESSSVWPTTVIRGDVNTIKIGKRSNLQDGTIVHVNHAGPFNVKGDVTTIGNDVTVGHRALIHACQIGDRCLIGMGAIIMDGAVVESDVLVAGGSLVVPGTVLKSGYLWMGSPAKQIRELTDKEKEKILYSATYYAELGARHSARR